ncbi:nucleotidyltransferase [Providencia vermicola]|uniref:nucleotidyltransferase domain-containing protein n=1 Tax=Providencia TaxID=586 RepID=UPI0019D06AB1|nr:MULTISPECIES: nucleotidyltransferase [Providencia]ELR5048375.1 nucleotidyltransferase [Providencia rettgeri]MBN6366277.1 nucleotidyltransferase [Providencia rettgeri]MCG5276719.1 nucleotidyltransferase [Providencia rettgeri]MCG9506238.1 nucleotidyltransferase [Providencia rettgeri]
MSLENKLSSWTSPSSNTEQDKQDRTERMIRLAISSHEPFNNCSLKIYAKGSYANNTNVRSDSDVDIAVECTEAVYWDVSEGGNKPQGEPYEGIWTPKKLRNELVAAMEAKFPGQVDCTGSTAIQINSNSARVDADVVPCFKYQYIMLRETREGTKIFKTDGSSIVNYPVQQLENGRLKNNQTNYAYKKGARLLKRIENAMAEDEVFKELPSFFMECLAYNCPNTVFSHSTWTDCLKAMLFHIWENLQGDEPTTERWLEVNECFYLFHSKQKWTREDGREFAKAAWNYFGFN